MKHGLNMVEYEEKKAKKKALKEKSKDKGWDGLSSAEKDEINGQIAEEHGYP